MDEMNQLKVFTVEEANQLLPRLTELIAKAQAKQEAVLKKEVEIDTLEILAPGAEEGQASPEVAAQIKIYNRGVNEFYEIVDEIHETGCFLKDIEAGLIDFYALHEGQVVYLCWKLGEESVGFWHEVGKGYAYRQAISPKNHPRDEKESSLD